MSRHIAIVPESNKVGVDVTTATIAAIREAAPDFDVIIVDVPHSDRKNTIINQLVTSSLMELKRQLYQWFAPSGYPYPDYSIDTTVERPRYAGATVLEMPINVGIASATLCGYEYALEHDYDVAVLIEGDGQHDPRDIHDLLECLHGDPTLDMVTGSRFLPRSDGQDSKVIGHLGIRLFSKVISVIAGQRVTDPTSSFRMTNRRGTESFVNGYPHESLEVKAILLLHGRRLRSCESPVGTRPRRPDGPATSSPPSFYYMTKVLMQILVGLLPAPANSERQMLRGW